MKTHKYMRGESTPLITVRNFKGTYEHNLFQVLRLFQIESSLRLLIDAKGFHWTFKTVLVKVKSTIGGSKFRANIGCFLCLLLYRNCAITLLPLSVKQFFPIRNRFLSLLWQAQSTPFFATKNFWSHFYSERWDFQIEARLTETNFEVIFN